MDRTSNKEALIVMCDSQNRVLLKDWVRYGDDSGLVCQVSFRAFPVELIGHTFHVGLEQTILFLTQVEELYSKNAGEAELTAKYDGDNLRIVSRAWGRIEIHFKALVFGNIQQKVELGFESDQTVLPSFIQNLKEIVKDLELDGGS